MKANIVGMSKGIDKEFWDKLKINNDFSNGNDSQVYQVYLNGDCIAECEPFEEAETIVNGESMNGSINIERID